MARPSRQRRICLKPEYDRFAPCGVNPQEKVVLSIDEFETIRLIDNEKRTHAQCAAQMNVSRTTVTEMYARAREKIADSLINGKVLCISGGNYSFCDGSAWRCCGRRCGRREMPVDRCVVKGREEEPMKIAVTYENGHVFQHFGHTAQVKLYEVEAGNVTQTAVVATAGHGHGALADFLREMGVDTLICGGIGAGAQEALAVAGITLYGGVSGDADEAVKALLSGGLCYDPNVHCNHHGEGHGHGAGHSCGGHDHGEGAEHHCGGHTCGKA